MTNQPLEDRLELSLKLIAVTNNRSVPELRNEAADMLLGKYQVGVSQSSPPSASSSSNGDQLHAKVGRPPRQTARSTPKQRTHIGRELTNVVDGHHVYYKGVEGVTRGGRLWIGGEAFDAPSPAGQRAAVIKSLPPTEVNGWQNWKDLKGRTLAEIHDRALRPI